MKCVLAFGLALLVVSAVLFTAGCGGGATSPAPDRLSDDDARAGLPLSPAASLGPAALAPWRVFSPVTDGTALALTPDGTRAVCSYWNLLSVYDLSTGACLKTLNGHTAQVLAVAVTPDGTRAVSGSTFYEGNILEVWSLSTGACLETIAGPTSLGGVAVLPGGSQVVVGGNGGFVGTHGL